MRSNENLFVLGQCSKSNNVMQWRVDFDNPKLFSPAKLKQPLNIAPNRRLTPIGNYLLEWGSGKKGGTFDYILHEYVSKGSKGVSFETAQSGTWEASKFFYGHLDFGHDGNQHKDGPNTRAMRFVSMSSYIMAWVAEPGRGDYRLWNFDPGSEDPLQPKKPDWSKTGETKAPSIYGIYTDGAWGDIQQGHTLIGMNNYVIDWEPENGNWRLWSFDPQNRNPICGPALSSGNWDHIGSDHELLAMGDYLLDWEPKTREYRLWQFNSRSKSLIGKRPIKSGRLPKSVASSMVLTSVIPVRKAKKAQANTPGTTDFMRKKIKHVVYYMVENRSFDHVCGWLYDQDNIPAQIIGREGPFEGARKSDVNMNAEGKEVPISVYKDGKLSCDFNLELLPSDPHHDHSDVMRQMFHPDGNGYKKGKTPNMGGFVINNALDQVMETYSPEQLPVLNGLAKDFAVSDAWFCSMPGGTDVNRAFSLTGSSFGLLDNFQNGPQYAIWPLMPHRPSIWKTLMANGVSDWKIYNSIEWIHHVFTYHLFLDGQIASVDEDVAEAKKLDGKPSEYISSIDQLKKDSLEGNLPAFSYIEPIWIAKTGTTSYHPGADLIPGEVALNELYEALKAGPNWDETLLVITFDEHGGIFDHVPPPYAENPWPNDENNGYDFDIMGIRVPTILVSPMIEENTVFRTDTNVEYDATSFLATLLNWFGIPKSRWGLGERVAAAPTFENVFTREEARTDMPQYTLPYDKDNPPSGGSATDIPPHDLHRIIAHRVIMSMGKDAMQLNDLVQSADQIAYGSETVEEMTDQIQEFSGMGKL